MSEHGPRLSADVVEVTVVQVVLKVDIFRRDLRQRGHGQGLEGVLQRVRAQIIFSACVESTLFVYDPFVYPTDV